MAICRFAEGDGLGESWGEEWANTGGLIVNWVTEIVVALGAQIVALAPEDSLT